MTTKSPNARKKVLIVDDHALVREGLGAVINQQQGLEVCAAAADAPAALNLVVRHRPDIVIVDISLEQGSGLDLIKDIHARCPKLPIIALSMHHEDLYAARALRAGASGYVMKREPAAMVVAAIREVLGGQVAFSENIVRQILKPPSSRQHAGASDPIELLSDRELDIFRFMGAGLGTRAIAAKLHIAVSTVETHRASLKQKLGLKNATELVSRAAQFVSAETRP